MPHHWDTGGRSAEQYESERTNPHEATRSAASSRADFRQDERDAGLDGKPDTPDNKGGADDNVVNPHEVTRSDFRQDERDAGLDGKPDDSNDKGGADDNVVNPHEVTRSDFRQDERDAGLDGNTDTSDNKGGADDNVVNPHEVTRSDFRQDERDAGLDGNTDTSDNKGGADDNVVNPHEVTRSDFRQDERDAGLDGNPGPPEDNGEPADTNPQPPIPNPTDPDTTTNGAANEGGQETTQENPDANDGGGQDNPPDPYAALKEDPAVKEVLEFAEGLQTTADGLSVETSLTDRDAFREQAGELQELIDNLPDGPVKDQLQERYKELTDGRISIGLRHIIRQNSQQARQEEVDAALSRVEQALEAFYTAGHNIGRNSGDPAVRAARAELIAALNAVPGEERRAALRRQLMPALNTSGSDFYDARYRDAPSLTQEQAQYNLNVAASDLIDAGRNISRSNADPAYLEACSAFINAINALPSEAARVAARQQFAALLDTTGSDYVSAKYGGWGGEYRLQLPAEFQDFQFEGFNLASVNAENVRQLEAHVVAGITAHNAAVDAYERDRKAFDSSANPTPEERAALDKRFSDLQAAGAKLNLEYKSISDYLWRNPEAVRAADINLADRSSFTGDNYKRIGPGNSAPEIGSPDEWRKINTELDTARDALDTAFTDLNGRIDAYNALPESERDPQVGPQLRAESNALTAELQFQNELGAHLYRTVTGYDPTGDVESDGSFFDWAWDVFTREEQGPQPFQGFDAQGEPIGQVDAEGRYYDPATKTFRETFIGQDGNRYYAPPPGYSRETYTELTYDAEGNPVYQTLWKLADIAETPRTAQEKGDQAAEQYATEYGPDNAGKTGTGPGFAAEDGGGSPRLLTDKAGNLWLLADPVTDPDNFHRQTFTLLGNDAPPETLAYLKDLQARNQERQQTERTVERQSVTAWDPEIDNMDPGLAADPTIAPGVSARVIKGKNGKTYLLPDPAVDPYSFHRERLRILGGDTPQETIDWLADHQNQVLEQQGRAGNFNAESARINAAAQTQYEQLSDEAKTDTAYIAPIYRSQIESLEALQKEYPEFAQYLEEPITQIKENLAELDDIPAVGSQQTREEPPTKPEILARLEQVKAEQIDLLNEWGLAPQKGSSFLQMYGYTAQAENPVAYFQNVGRVQESDAYRPLILEEVQLYNLLDAALDKEDPGRSERYIERVTGVNYTRYKEVTKQLEAIPARDKYGYINLRWDLDHAHNQPYQAFSDDYRRFQEQADSPGYKGWLELTTWKEEADDRLNGLGVSPADFVLGLVPLAGTVGLFLDATHPDSPGVEAITPLEDGRLQEAAIADYALAPLYALSIISAPSIVIGAGRTIFRTVTAKGITQPVGRTIAQTTAEEIPEVLYEGAVNFAVSGNVDIAGALGEAVLGIASESFGEVSAPRARVTRASSGQLDVSPVATDEKTDLPVFYVGPQIGVDGEVVTRQSAESLSGWIDTPPIVPMVLFKETVNEQGIAGYEQIDKADLPDKFEIQTTLSLVPGVTDATLHQGGRGGVRHYRSPIPRPTPPLRGGSNDNQIYPELLSGPGEAQARPTTAGVQRVWTTTDGEIVNLTGRPLPGADADTPAVASRPAEMDLVAPEPEPASGGAKHQTRLISGIVGNDSLSRAEKERILREMGISPYEINQHLGRRDSKSNRPKPSLKSKLAAGVVAPVMLASGVTFSSGSSPSPAMPTPVAMSVASSVASAVSDSRIDGQKTSGVNPTFDAARFDAIMQQHLGPQFSGSNADSALSAGRGDSDGTASENAESSADTATAADDTQSAEVSSPSVSIQVASAVDDERASVEESSQQQTAEQVANQQAQQQAAQQAAAQQAQQQAAQQAAAQQAQQQAAQQAAAQQAQQQAAQQAAAQQAQQQAAEQAAAQQAQQQAVESQVMPAAAAQVAAEVQAEAVQVADAQAVSAVTDSTAVTPAAVATPTGKTLEATRGKTPPPTTGKGNGGQAQQQAQVIRNRNRGKGDEPPKVIELKPPPELRDTAPKVVEWVSHNKNVLNLETGEHEIAPQSDSNLRSLQVTERVKRKLNRKVSVGALDIDSKDGTVIASSEKRRRKSDANTVVSARLDTNIGDNAAYEELLRPRRAKRPRRSDKDQDGDSATPTVNLLVE